MIRHEIPAFYKEPHHLPSAGRVGDHPRRGLRAVAALRPLAVAGIAALLVLLTACRPPPQRVGPFLRNVSVSGSALVMEACEIEMRGNDIDVGACSLATTALPITAVLPPSPAYAEIVAAITSEMRTGVAACGTRHQVVGTVEVVVTVNYAGRLIAVAPRTGSRAFADCTGSALSSARFPRSRQGGTTPIPFELASPTP